MPGKINTYNLEAKIKNRGTLRRIIAKLSSTGKKSVFTNGCFDLIHYGHVKYLQDAKKLGDILIVAVNSDASVRKIKGNKRPIVCQGDRMKVIAALESVDFVTMFGEDNPLNTIKMLKPGILVKGADWGKDDIVGAGFVKSYGGKVKTIKLAKGRSTTNLINKIAKSL